MLRTVLILLLLSGSLLCYSQENTGFYVALPEKQKNCPNQFKTFDERQNFCAPMRPVIDQSAFTSISEVQIDSRNRRKYADLYLSTRGMQQLKTIVASFPNATLLLVVDNRVVGQLKNKDVVGRFIRIDGDPNTKEIDWLYERLKKDTADTEL